MALRPQHVAPELLTKVTKALGITALDQWYYVSHYAATEAIGARALNKCGGTIASFLKHAYPQHSFDEAKLESKVNLEKDQKFFEVIIRQLFPNVEIHTKARKAVGIINPDTGAYLEIDFWIPSLKLGIEFQDKHHYEYQWYANNTLENYQKRDDIKKVAMSNLGYTLINIGFWWDKTLASVAATIRKVRPDLLPEYEKIGTPIPSEPPQSNIGETQVIPGIAGIMSPFIPSNDFNPINWYAGEKHDGIRGVYNPALNKMFSRSGNELSVLPCLLKDIPNLLVEGEITAGRGNYPKTAAVSYQSHHEKVNWPMFRYVLFDIPNAESGNYTQRYSAISSELMAYPFIFSQSAFRVLLGSKDQLKMLVSAIISDTGEGVIAQQDSQYEYGRAKSLAKIKVRRDADAQVLDIGKLSCTCKLVSGITAIINYSDDFKSNQSNLNVGDIVSYYHNGYSQNGVPKRAEIYKIRYDIAWEQLIGDTEQTVPKLRAVTDAIGSSALIERNSVKNKMGHWNKRPNVRAFFDRFAHTAGFDPLVAENWYPVKMRDLQTSGGGGLLKSYGYSRKKALSFAYPQVEFEAKKFRTCEQPQVRTKWGHWNESSNARAFFDEFARSSRFNPLEPENWYQVKIRSLQKAKGDGLIKAFSNNIKSALSFAYPELKFETKKFIPQEKPKEKKHDMGYWKKAVHVRKFFDEFARKSGFDPLVAENWYSVRLRVLQNAGGSGLIHSYDYNREKALSCAYPELNFDSKKFRTIEKQGSYSWGHWNKLSNVRAFFDKFARTSRFNPRVAENWYPVKMIDLQNAGGGGLLSAYDKDLQSAISSAYPCLKLDKEKFETYAVRGRWSRPENVRAYFDALAETAGFNPHAAENWSTLRPSTLQRAKGSGILHTYDHNVKKALTVAYPELKFEIG